MNTTLIDKARAWVESDPDPVTREQGAALLARADAGELASHFDGLLEFGTAGLRAKVGTGSMRMNSAVVRIASWAVARHLRNTVAAGKTPLVVLGYDARLSSRSRSMHCIRQPGCRASRATRWHALRLAARASQPASLLACLFGLNVCLIATELAAQDPCWRHPPGQASSPMRCRRTARAPGTAQQPAGS